MNLFNKYFLPFISDCNSNLAKSQDKIELILYNYTSCQKTMEETTYQLSLIDETIPIKWILHHWKIDLLNHNTSQCLIKESQGKSLKVYKYFEKIDYGYNLLEELYTREFIRVGLNNSKIKKAKIFNLSTLVENENNMNVTEELMPKITSTVFNNHKNKYLIYDWGILKPYHDGEIWDSNHKIYFASKKNKKVRAKKFSVSQGSQRIDYYTNHNGSRTIVDNNGNVEIVKPNGTIEIKFADGSKLIEFVDGTIHK